MALTDTIDLIQIFTHGKPAVFRSEVADMNSWPTFTALCRQ